LYAETEENHEESHFKIADAKFEIGTEYLPRLSAGAGPNPVREIRSRAELRIK
jgi:hypothetical protein